MCFGFQNFASAGGVPPKLPEHVRLLKRGFTEVDHYAECSSSGSNGIDVGFRFPKICQSQAMSPWVENRG